MSYCSSILYRFLRIVLILTFSILWERHQKYHDYEMHFLIAGCFVGFYMSLSYNSI